MILLISSLLIALMVHFRQRLDHLNKNLKGIENTDPIALCRSRYFLYSVLLDPRTGRWNDPDTRYSLALVDIDRFREVNDTYGHDTGDRCITAVASVLTDCTRAEYGDCVARIGGDDFIVLWNNITRDRLQHKL